MAWICRLKIGGIIDQFWVYAQDQTATKYSDTKLLLLRVLGPFWTHILFQIESKTRNILKRKTSQKRVTNCPLGIRHGWSWTMDIQKITRMIRDLPKSSLLKKCEFRSYLSSRKSVETSSYSIFMSVWNNLNPIVFFS